MYFISVCVFGLFEICCDRSDVQLMFLLAGKYAQVTNNPENDGCINAVLLV